MRLPLKYLFGVLLVAVCLSPVMAKECNQIDDNNKLRPIKILYFALGAEGGQFWHMKQHLAIAAAKDLGLDLEVILVNSANHSTFIKRLDKKIQQDGKPDYLLGYFYHNYDDLLLPLTKKYQLPFFSVNTSFNQAVSQFTGKPREKFTYWIGHMAPDDYIASQKLVRDLVTANQDKKIKLAMIGGDFDSTTVGLNRRRGVTNYTTVNDIDTLPFIPSGWRAKEAELAMDKIIYRKMQFNALWTGSANIARGVIRSINKQGLNAETRPKIGTFDWTLDVFNMVKNGQIAIAYGGHFTESARALILLLDHANGIDFKSDLGLIIKTQLRPLTKKNADNRTKLIKAENWPKLNFKTMSKCFNPELKKYDFTTRL